MSRGIFDLSGSVALVTGSSQGLGLAMARGLGRAGARIVLNGRDADKLAGAVEGLSGEGIECTGEAFDVTDSSAVAGAAEGIRQRLGPIDVLVNNAGIHRRAPLEKLSDEQWQAVIDVNLTGAFRVARAVVGDMIERKRGKIVNVCSLMGELARPTTGAYAAAKGGLKMLTRAMATEWGRHNVQVNGLAPGYFVTPMTQPLADNAEFDRWLKARTPAGRWGNVEELVGPAVFLASRASSFVNGQVLYVDGGVMAAL
jgi:gluconate 5-dehydrogenase